jgi:phage recombination protein Bet
MSTELVNKPSALAVMAGRISVDPSKLLGTLKETVFKGAKDSELLALVVVANEYGLNPFLKELYAFPAKGGGIVPVVSIDGWISMINRQPNLDGVEFSMTPDGEECTCKMFIKGRSHPVVITEYKEECFRATEPWKQMPKRMLRHKALIQAARVAFGFSGIFDEDEARTIAARPVEGRVIADVPDFTSAPVEEAAPEKPKKAAKKEPAPASEDVFDGDDIPTGDPTPQTKIGIFLAESEVAEKDFVAWLKKSLQCKIDTLADLQADYAEDMVANWGKIFTAFQEAAK